MRRKSLAVIRWSSWLLTILATRMPAQEPGPGAGFYISEYAANTSRAWEREDALDVTGFERPMTILEVTRFPDPAEPTPGQERAANELVGATFDAAMRHGWFDFAQASRDGFELMFGDKIHYAQLENIRDDRILDPEKPEFLLYYDTAAGKKLAGVMFLVREPRERGPQIGGPLTVWHYHFWVRERCLLDGLLLVADRRFDGTCPAGEPTDRSPEMIHVWFLDHPEGPFATRMSLPPKVLRQLEERDF
jgi:hypothetical protein